VSDVPRRWIVIGNPDHRRVTGFVDAVRREGAGAVVVVPWMDVVGDPEWWTGLDDAPSFVRIESLGEHPGVQRAMLELGGLPAVRDLPFGAFVPPRPSHRGFLALLGRVERGLAARPGWVPLADPASIRLVFDKHHLHAACRALGVSVPESLEATRRDELERGMAERGWSRAFVKIRTGSSAVGVGIYDLAPAPRFTTTVHMSDAGWFNSMRLRRYTHSADLDRVFAGLAAHGVHVERAVDKAHLDGANFDCRVLVIDEQPRFVVVRQSRHPITNLHLGGWRGDLERLRELCPPRTWAAAMADAVRVAAHYGGLHLGVDVCFSRDLERHYVLEANAFGDLLPRLRDGSGRDVYAAEVAAAPSWLRRRAE